MSSLKKRMMEQVSQLKKSLDERKENERKLILLIAVLVLVFGSFDFVLYGLWGKTFNLYNESAKINQKITITQQTIEQTRKTSGIDPNDQLKQKIARLEQQSDTIEQSIETYTSAFVDARQMGQLLGAIMDRHPGLVLKKVTNRPFITVDIPGIEEPWLYRHGLFLEMEGNYLDVMDYIRQVEGLPRKIQWDSLSFKVEEFPVGTLQIEVFTLSISKEWLGA